MSRLARQQRNTCKKHPLLPRSTLEALFVERSSQFTADVADEPRGAMLHRRPPAVRRNRCIHTGLVSSVRWLKSPEAITKNLDMGEGQATS